MLWSSLPPSELPAVGDRVCIDSTIKSYEVTARIRDEHGQVWLELAGHWERVECVHWAPAPGDICTILLKSYIDWVAARMDYQRNLAQDDPKEWKACQDRLKGLKKDMAVADDAGSWLYGELHLVSLDHNWATVQAGGKGPHRQLPLSTIAVLRRGKTHATA
jgi:hypothetical protein